MEYYSAIKKNENLLSATTWMDLESTILNEISQIETNTVSYHLHVGSKKYNKLVNITKKKQTHRYREQASGHQWGEGREAGQYRGSRLRDINCCCCC